MDDKNYIKELEAKNQALSEAVQVCEGLTLAALGVLQTTVPAEAFADVANTVADILETETNAIFARYNERVAA